MVKAPAAVPSRQKRGFLGLPVATVDTLRFSKWRPRIVLISMAIVNGGFADAPDLGPCEIIDLRTSLCVSKNDRFTTGKRDFSQSAARSPPMSRNVVILAQILVHEPA
jgi:hypothetical protein